MKISLGSEISGTVQRNCMKHNAARQCRL